MTQNGKTDQVGPNALQSLFTDIAAMTEQTAKTVDIGGSPDQSLMKLAAYLDGEATPDETVTMQAHLSQSDADLMEATSAMAYLESALNSPHQPAPNDLVNAAKSIPALYQVIPKKAISRFWLWSGVMATVAVVVVITMLFVLHPSTIGPSVSIPVAEHKSKDAPRLMPAGSEQTVPDKNGAARPRMAPEGPDNIIDSRKSR